MCREVCTAVIGKKRKMNGTFDNLVQIDEARFISRRKYNHGCFLAGDEQPESEDEEAEVVNRRNHGARVDGRPATRQRLSLLLCGAAWQGDPYPYN